MLATLDMLLAYGIAITGLKLAFHGPRHHALTTACRSGE